MYNPWPPLLLLCLPVHYLLYLHRATVSPVYLVHTKFIFTRSPLNDFDHHWHLTPRCHWFFQQFYFRRHNAMQLSSRTGMYRVCTPCHCTLYRGKRQFFFVAPRSAETAVWLAVELLIDCRALVISHMPRNWSELTNPPPYCSFIVSCNSICCCV